jgi:hypothetical protein
VEKRQTCFLLTNVVIRSGGGSGGSFAARALGLVVLRDHSKQCPSLEILSVP